MILSLCKIHLDLANIRLLFKIKYLVRTCVLLAVTTNFTRGGGGGGADCRQPMAGDTHLLCFPVAFWGFLC